MYDDAAAAVASKRRRCGSLFCCFLLFFLHFLTSNQECKYVYTMYVRTYAVYIKIYVYYYIHFEKPTTNEIKWWWWRSREKYYIENFVGYLHTMKWKCVQRNIVCIEALFLTWIEFKWSHFGGRIYDLHPNLYKQMQQPTQYTLFLSGARTRTRTPFCRLSVLRSRCAVNVGGQNTINIIGRRKK